MLFTRWIFAAAVALCAYSCKDARLPQNERDFSYKDTASISRICISDKNGARSDIQRKGRGWTVNQKYTCRSEAILNLLEVIKRIEVKAPVSKDFEPTLLKSLSTSAIKVEVFVGSDCLRVFYVGFETEDGEGNYMLLENTAKQVNFEHPLICCIPGFKGYLRPRFIADPKEWRDRLVVHETPESLKSIKVFYNEPFRRDSSFQIIVQSTTSFALQNLQGQALPFNMEAMRQYLRYFMNIQYERLITSANLKREDSLRHTPPFVTITVTSRTQQSQTFNFYRAAFKGTVNPELGVQYQYDPDRCYLNFAGGSEWAMVQYFVFGKWMVTPAYFKDPVQK